MMKRVLANTKDPGCDQPLRRDDGDSSESIKPFQVVVLILSIFVVASLSVELIFNIPEEIVEIFLYVDFLICLIFFADFLQQFSRADSKIRFMKWGWLDLISCIPLMEMNQFARVIRVVRLIKAIKSISEISHALTENKASSSIHFLIVVSLMVMLFGSIYILYLERHIPGSNIQTAADAFWWTFITITTVGYGDFYPVTPEGRLVAVILISIGVGMFGSLTAILASWILNPEQEKVRDEQLAMQVEELKSEVSELKELMIELKKQRS